MLSSRNALKSLMASAMIANLGSLSAASEAMPPPRNLPRRKQPQTDLEREIAEHNEVVERRRQERLARRAGR